MSTLRISDAPLLPDVDGTEKIPTGGRGDYAISVDQIKDHIFQDVGKELVGLGNVDNTSDLDKPVSTAQQAALNLKADKTYVDTNLDLKADKTNVYTRSETSLALSRKADLVNGVVPESQIPSSFNDVLEFTTPNLPIIGESGKIYVTTDTNKTWRWATNKYVEISGWNPDSVSKAATLPTYYTKESGVDPITGVTDGAYFNVLSSNDESYIEGYQNVGGSAVATGKSCPSGSYVDNIVEYTALPFKAGKSYALHERVQLASGDIVRSTVTNNAVNPNIDMTGWVNAEADQLVFNTMVSTQVDDLESYIVYAEKYGASLNEAMTSINAAFTGKRVRVYVPSDFPVTATVNLNIDCDLDLSTLQVQSDIDVIFNPKVDWSGTTTPCDIKVNNKSCRVGWDLNKALGIVELDKMRFFDVGNQTANTSASSWTAFRVSIVNIKRIDMIMPSTFNSYVVPNGTVGDEAGTNRNIVIDGIMTTSTFASDINIKNPTAVDLETGEDSDSIVINTNATSLANTVFNIDIDNIYSKNVQKRALKVIGWNNASGIRLNGNHVMIGGGSEPLSAIDVSGNCRVDANGSAVGSNWTYGLYAWNGARFIGDFSMDFDLGETQVIRGNQVRGINQNTNPATTIDITRCHIIGGTEFASVIEGHTLNIKDVKHVAYNRSASFSGYVDIGKYALEFKDPAVIPTRGSYLIAFNSANKKFIKNFSVISTVSTPIGFVIRSIVTSDVEVTDAKVTGTFTIGFGDLNTASNNKYRRCSISSGTYMFSCTNGGSNLLLDQCKPNAAMIANASANPLTNVIELNTQTF